MEAFQAKDYLACISSLREEIKNILHQAVTGAFLLYGLKREAHGNHAVGGKTAPRFKHTVKRNGRRQAVFIVTHNSRCISA